MSLIGTVANYGGRQPDNFSNVKQFVVGPSSNIAEWVYIKSSPGSLSITPARKKTSLTIDGDLTVIGSIFNPSDRLLKDEIKSISISKIENLFNLEPVEYKFKNDITKKIRYGLIAQDVEKIYPELVSNNDSDYKAVNYIELIPMLLSKMKEMQKEIDELREQIDYKNK